jgi:hypothetical protein
MSAFGIGIPEIEKCFCFLMLLAIVVLNAYILLSNETEFVVLNVHIFLSNETEFSILNAHVLPSNETEIVVLIAHVFLFKMRLSLLF